MNNFKLKIKHFYKTISLIVILLLSLSCSENEEITSTQPNNSTQSSQSPCIDGLAGNYPCNGFDLMGEIDVLNPLCI